MPGFKTGQYAAHGALVELGPDTALASLTMVPCRVVLMLPPMGRTRPTPWSPPAVGALAGTRFDRRGFFAFAVVEPTVVRPAARSCGECGSTGAAAPPPPPPPPSSASSMNDARGMLFENMVLHSQRTTRSVWVCMCDLTWAPDVGACELPQLWCRDVDWGAWVGCSGWVVAATAHGRSALGRTSPI